MNSPAFFEEKWLNKSTSAKTWQTAVDAKITRTAWDLNSIQTTSGPHAGAVTAKYLETLSTAGLAEYRGQLTKEAQGWENVKLECLSGVFGIDQPDAHRAWCDVQANALLYGKLKELAR